MVGEALIAFLCSLLKGLMEYLPNVPNDLLTDIDLTVLATAINAVAALLPMDVILLNIQLWAAIMTVRFSLITLRWIRTAGAV